MSPQLSVKLVFAISFIFVASAACAESKKPLSDDEIAKLLIQQSIAAYPKSCACPYSTAKNGSSCGGRSAYSRKGGYAPLCYRSDVSEEMIRNWRADSKR